MSFVGVRSCYSLPEAMVVRSVLAARGVTVALTNENLAFQSWNWLVALGGIEVLVFEAERDLALSLLAPVATDARNAESEAFRRRPVWNCIGTLIAVVTLGLWMPFWIRHRHISPDGPD